MHRYIFLVSYKYGIYLYLLPASRIAVVVTVVVAVDANRARGAAYWVGGESDRE